MHEAHRPEGNLALPRHMGGGATKAHGAAAKVHPKGGGTRHGEGEVGALMCG